jgi:hypothetical protein
VEASYRVARQFSHGGHWARATVSVEGAPQNGVAVADTAFAWREYPPGPYGEDLSSEPIEDAPVDTGPGDVKLAAAHATWAALGFVPNEPPWLSKDGPVFPI